MHCRPTLKRPIVLLALLCLSLSITPTFGQSSDPNLTRAIEIATLAYLETIPDSPPVVTTSRLADGWAFGMVAVPTATDEHAHPHAFLFVARKKPGGWQAALEPTPLYRELARLAPPSVMSPEIQAFTSHEGDAPLRLSLPWATGETWQFSGGPHGPMLEAVDFANGSQLVRAAHDGIVYRPCPSMVIIYQENGWQTGYYHLSNIAVADGQAITRGQLLGISSTAAGCGGWATGPHVHFWIQRHGQPLPIAGQVLGGWTVYNGNGQYLGCMSKHGTSKCAGFGEVYNDGTIGAAGAPPAAPRQQPQPGILVRDTDDPNVERGGTPGTLYTAPAGSIVSNGHASWAMRSPGAQNNYVKWKPPLDQCGNWELYAYVPYVTNGIFDTNHASYKIRHRQGNTPAAVEETRVLNIDALGGHFAMQSERWYSLGTFLWSKDAHQAGEYVLLGDHTGEGGARGVVFDDMRWIFRGGDEAACATTTAPAPPPAPSLAPPAPAAAPQASQDAGIVVRDTDDPNVERGGTPGTLYTAPAGSIVSDGHATWTVSSASGVDNYIKWKPPLNQCGNWELYAYIPYVTNGLFDTTHAVYKIRHRQGNTPAGAEQTRIINIEALGGHFAMQSERWYSLGTLLWSKDANQAGEYVLLEDQTGEPGLRGVVFDDMRWVFRGADEAACK